MARKKSKPSKPRGRASADDLMRELIERMEACDDAETLNDEVIIPFAAALETVCGARGYLLTIYGETSNIVFTGEPDDAAAVYDLVENFLDARDAD